MNRGWIDSSISFESIASLGWLASITIQLVILLLVVWIFILRMLRRNEERRRRHIANVWQPLLAESLVGDPGELPSIHPRDHVLFLYLWNQFQESIKGEASARLNEMARRTGIDKVAISLLHTGRLRLEILAVVTLGHLKEVSVWDVLVHLTRAPNAVLALEAARAIIRIDPKAAIPLLIPVLSTRTDWSPLKIMAILKESDMNLVATALAQAVVLAPPPIAARLIRLLTWLRTPGALPIVRQRIADREANEDVLASSLSYFGECSDPDDLPRIRSYLTHPTWYIRVQAARALGKMGLEEDEVRLIELLKDTYWWVRYRAAEALSNLPSMSEAKLADLGTSMTGEALQVLTPFLTQLHAKNAPTVPVTETRGTS